MIVKCKNCQTSFNLKDSLIKKNSIKVRCSKCRHIFKIYQEKDFIFESSEPLPVIIFSADKAEADLILETLQEHDIDALIFSSASKAKEVAKKMERKITLCQQSLTF
ncbi:hypothetical protein GMMP15_930008 [Candidatus Magnetomoraceae bacterium gMMP-15]